MSKKLTTEEFIEKAKKYYGTYKNEIHDTKELIKLLTN